MRVCGHEAVRQGDLAPAPVGRRINNPPRGLRLPRAHQPQELGLCSGNPSWWCPLHAARPKAQLCCGACPSSPSCVLCERKRGHFRQPLPFEPRLRPGADFIAQDASTLELANLKMFQPESTWTSNLWSTSTLGYQLEITQPGFAKDGTNLSPAPPNSRL